MPIPFASCRRLLPVVAAALAAALAAQDPPAAPAPAPQSAPPVPHFVVRSYPRDRDVPVAVVANRPVTLGDLVDHLDERHHPGLRKALEQGNDAPEIQRLLVSDLIAPWVRQFADLKALQHHTAGRSSDPKALEAAQSEQLKRSFQAYLDHYVKQLADQGRPTELSQKRVNRLLADYQLRHGLAAELQGLLDHLEPDTYTRTELQEFFNANARAFGGQVTIAHILVQHRDAGTGILLNDEGVARASARLADIRARLRPDGSNFEAVARLVSEDTRTAKDGGVLSGVHRFDDRLPPALCRTAWFLRDGEVSDVVESPYGWHLVKRIDFAQHIFVLFTDDAIPSIREVMRRARQEDLLFTARKQAAVKLLL